MELTLGNVIFSVKFIQWPWGLACQGQCL